MRFRKNKNGEFPSEGEIMSMGINEYFDSIIDPFRYVEGYYGRIDEYYGGNVPVNVVQEFKMNPYKDYILENLQTHDSDLFVSKMIKTFKEYSIRDISTTSSPKRFVKVLFPCSENDYERENEIYDFLDSDKFLNFISFFGYTKSRVSFINSFIKGTGISVIIEPVYAEDANDLVYKECKGILYHVTYGDLAEDILNSGLRIRTGRRDMSKYRDFPQRIYLLAIPSETDVVNSDEIKCAVDIYLDDNVAERNGISIFKVDVRNTSLNFYMDSASQDDDIDYAVYTYNNIPKESVKLFFKGSKDKLYL